MGPLKILVKELGYIVCTCTVKVSGDKILIWTPLTLSIWTKTVKASLRKKKKKKKIWLHLNTKASVFLSIQSIQWKWLTLIIWTQTVETTVFSPAEESQSNRFGMTLGYVNDRIFILGWTVSTKLSYMAREGHRQGWLCAFPIPHAYFTLFCSLFRKTWNCNFSNCILTSVLYTSTSQRTKKTLFDIKSASLTALFVLHLLTLLFAMIQAREVYNLCVNGPRGGKNRINITFKTALPC